MTITKNTQVPMDSGYLTFFWKMKQISLMDLTAAVTSRIVSTYAMKKNDGTAYKIAVWVLADAAGIQQLNMGVADSIPDTHTDVTFAFSNDACGVWLEKGGGDGEDYLVIGTGDIRNIGLNPAGRIHRIRLNSAEADAVIVTCSSDFTIRIYAPTDAFETPVAIPVTVVQN